MTGMGEDAKVTEDWKPIEIEPGFLIPYMVYATVMYTFIGLFVVFIKLDIRTGWVLINMVFGFTILLSDTAKKYFLKMLRGFIEPRIMAYALVNLGLVYAAVLLPSLLLNPAGSGSSASNPFVSNAIFLLFMLPLVPLFADAETKLFQGWIIKKFHSRDLVVCERCGRNALPCTKCDMCQADLLKTPAKDFASYLPAIVISGLIFGLAHVILIGTLFPMVLTFGGIFLGWLYIKEGALTVAKVHMLYNYLLITFIVLGVLI